MQPYDPSLYLSSGLNFDNQTTTCYDIPAPINSNGLLSSASVADYLKNSLPLLQLQMGLIFISTSVIHFLLKPFGSSSFVSSLLAGILLGPTCLGRYEVMQKLIFPPASQDVISTFALLGYNMFLFLGAVKMDIGMVLRTGHQAMSVGVLSVLVPLIFGLSYQMLHDKEFESEVDFHGSWRVILVHSITSYPVNSYMIGHQLKISNSELGRLSLSSGLVGDFLGLFMIIAVSLVRKRQWLTIVDNFKLIFSFIIGATLVLRPAMNWMISITPESKPVSKTCIFIVMAIAIGSEACFKYFNQVQYLGPFIIGLTVPAGAPLGSAFVEKFEPFVVDCPLQILTASFMMRADLSLVITEYTKLKKYICLIYVTCTLKLVATLVPSLWGRMPWIDAMALSAITNYKGIVQLSLAAVFRDTQNFSEEVFSLVSLSILLNTTITPLLVKYLYDPSRKYAGYQARNVMSLKPNSELKILSCIHRLGNADSIIRLLNAVHPSKDRPIGVYVLHLINLIGRSTPVLISHLKQKAISNSSSKNVISAFDQFEKRNWECVSINFFTAISTYKLMHEDICTLALDELTSLIIIPLHRHWSIHGNVESEDRIIRNLNCKILEKAPCSVGIFFDRGRLGRVSSSSSGSSVLSICMIFFGGEDDREALTLAKRIAGNSNVSLTVVHFTTRDTTVTNEDRKMDAVMINDVKQRAEIDEEDAHYIEHKVKDGPETLQIVRRIANAYDLFLLGRRYGMTSAQTTGLSEWSELRELGIIGDFFASKDLETKASVLVVQQQKQIKRLEIDYL